MELCGVWGASGTLRRGVLRDILGSTMEWQVQSVT